MKHLLLCCFLFVALLLPAQTLQEYYFNNSLAGTGGGGTLTELVSCTAAQGSFGTDSIITSDGLCSVSQAFCFNRGGGFSYPNSSITGSYTINLFFKFTAALTSYSRIIDFSNATSDGGFYLLNNCLNFYPNGNVGACIFQPNVYYLFTFVRDGATNIISVYVNGTLFSTYNDATNIYKPATTTTPIIFFRDDNVITCEVKPGCIKYAAVTQQQLTAQQVDSIWQNICSISLPPCSAAINYPGSPYNNTISTPQNVNQTGTTGGNYSSTAGLTINATTGAITPSTSTPGTYTVTYTVSDTACTSISATATVIIAGVPGCSANGNVVIFSNYDGGILNIDVDVNIPNLKIGVVSYEPVQINLTGTYAANVTKVIRAGFPNTTNNHCTPSVTSTSINGPTPANYSIVDIPPHGVSNSNGFATGIICATSCNTTTYQGGCNTMDQVLGYFNTQLGGTVYSLNTQYCCWRPANIYAVSELAGSCCVTSTPSATISYTGSPYCKSVSTAQAVTQTGANTGTYSASPAGLTINPQTGAITPSTSTVGIYTVTYTLPNCPNDVTATASVQITNSATATISYPAASFCSSASLQAATITGPTGGTFSSTSGLSLNANTGAIDPANSTSGNYTVTYTLAGSGCAGVTTTTQVAIVSSPSATISYSAASYCQGSAVQSVTVSGTTGGTFSSTAGLSLNAGTGAVTPATSTAGNYTITYTIPAGGSCNGFITTTTLQIVSSPTATITYAADSFCIGMGLKNVTITGTTGGTFSAASGLSLNSTTGAVDPYTSTAGTYTVTYSIAGGGCTGLTTTTVVTISTGISTGIARSMCSGDTLNFGGQLLTTAGIYFEHSLNGAGCDSLTSLVLTVDTTTVGATITSPTTKFCPGDSVQICAPTGFAGYRWNAGPQSRCMYARNGGNYYVTVTNANNCSAESNRIAITPYPAPSVSVSVKNDTLSVYNGISYQWFLNDAPISNATANVYVAPANGNYRVQVTDTNGCKATSNPIAVSITDLREVVTGNLLNIYPNPLESGIWTLECSKDMLNKDLEIFDASGRIVYRAEITSIKSTLNFEAAKGIYYMRISGVNRGVRKLVKL